MNSEKVILITGTSSGLGLHSAIQLAQQGHRVHASMRDTSKQTLLVSEAEKHGVTLTVCELDVQSQKSVDACVRDILEEEGRLDVLVNNAGAGFVRTTEQAEEAEVDWVMDVNFQGVVRCTKAVLPFMREARSGHIINITSVGGLVGQPFNEFYCGAKFAVEGYTESLASYVQPAFGIKFSLVEPGGIQSEFANSVLKQLESTGGIHDDEYRPILESYIGGSRERLASAYQTSEQVAEVVTQVVASEDPPIRIRTSEWAENFCSLKTQSDPDGKRQQQAVVEQFLPSLLN